MRSRVIQVLEPAIPPDPSQFKLGLYRHYKGGLCRALFISRDSNSVGKTRLLVVYLSLTTGVIWSRPLWGEDSSWSHRLMLGDKTYVDRFTYVGEIPADAVPADGTA